MKAATRSAVDDLGAILISIHAAREGGDTVKPEKIVLRIISIHAAREGGDSKIKVQKDVVLISIHAAREGGDPRIWYNLTIEKDFNPRRP